MLDSILLTFSKVKRIWNIFIYSHKEHKAKKKKKKAFPTRIGLLSRWSAKTTKI